MLFAQCCPEKVVDTPGEVKDFDKDKPKAEGLYDEELRRLLFKQGIEIVERFFP